MNTTKKSYLRLKVGNLIIAIWLATVPTAITYGLLSAHGLNVCRTLNSQLENLPQQYKIQEKCNDSAWKTTQNYIFIIGFFITLPTWLWIYLSMRKKQ